MTLAYRPMIRQSEGFDSEAAARGAVTSFRRDHYDDDLATASFGRISVIAPKGTHKGEVSYRWVVITAWQFSI